MLSIDTGDTKKITVTLYEKCNNTVDPYFTWVIKNKDTFEETIFYMDDFSTYPYYFNYFTLSVATYSGLTAGVINVPIGEYEYNVYEKSVPYSLTYSLSDNLVENGIFYVCGSASPYIPELNGTNNIIPALD